MSDLSERIKYLEYLIGQMEFHLMHLREVLQVLEIEKQNAESFLRRLENERKGERL